MINFMKENTAYALKDSLQTCKAKVHIYHGEKENKEIRLSAMEIQKKLGNSVIHPLSGLYHGEFSLNHADAYADAVREIIHA
jgi:hypothetical protein